MAGTLRSRNRRSAGAKETSANSGIDALAMDQNSSNIELYSKEVLNALIKDNLPPTPNNFSLYFDRLLEDKSESLRKQITDLLELEESNDAETTIQLEKSLKQGFASVKNILNTTANLYKNMNLMTKILDKRKKELEEHTDISSAMSITSAVGNDVSKLNTIVKKQSSHIKSLYDETASIIKTVENETIFDNKFGVYNKRYFITKIEQEVELVKEFNHKSSLILIELSQKIKDEVANEKAILLMTRTIARLLLKTSRRSDIVAHYGHGVFGMLLKHTDIESAKKASDRLCYLVSNSNFFLADKEIQLKISIGITDIDAIHTVQEIIVSAMTGIEKAYQTPKADYAVELREPPVSNEEG
jgi:diguanylate cyclase (GGDEF)-like protein